LDRERKRPQMNISLAAAEGILARALDVLNTGDRSLLAALDELPLPFTSPTPTVSLPIIILRASPSPAECQRWARIDGA
jgi:hypothetical protein